MMRVVVDGAQCAFLHVELAENHDTGTAQSADHLRIGINDMVCAAETVGGRNAGNVDVVFDSHRDAVEGAQALLAFGSLGSRIGLRHGSLATEGDVAVERAPHGIGALEVCAHQSPRIEHAAFDPSRELCNR